jgi:hypothetical protein
MTDQPQTPDSEGTGSEQEAAGVSPAGMTGSDFSSGEGMVALAGMIMLGVWLIFDVFLDDFGLASIELLLATTAVVVPRLNPNSVEKIGTVSTVMKVTGYAIAIVGAFFVIEAIEEGFYDDALTIIAALITYAAYAVAFLGARSIKS